jgi:hypothetical protein
LGDRHGFALDLLDNLRLEVSTRQARYISSCSHRLIRKLIKARGWYPVYLHALIVQSNSEIAAACIFDRCQLSNKREEQKPQHGNLEASPSL